MRFAVFFFVCGRGLGKGGVDAATAVGCSYSQGNKEKSHKDLKKNEF